MKFEILSIGGNTVMCNTGSGCVTYLHVPKQVLHHHGTRLHILLHLFPCFLTPLSNHVQVKNNPVHTLFSEGMFGLNYFRWRLVTVYITLESLPDHPQTYQSDLCANTGVWCMVSWVTHTTAATWGPKDFSGRLKSCPWPL